MDDIRQLESGLNGVAAKSALLGLPIDLSLAESVVKNIVNQRRKITLDAIKKLICKYFDVSADDLVSRSRKQNLVRPRQMAIYLSRRYTDSRSRASASLSTATRTALHSISCIEKAIKEDAATRKQVEFLIQKLESGKY